MLFHFLLDPDPQHWFKITANFRLFVYRKAYLLSGPAAVPAPSPAPVVAADPDCLQRPGACAVGEGAPVGAKPKGAAVPGAAAALGDREEDDKPTSMMMPRHRKRRRQANHHDDANLS